MVFPHTCVNYGKCVVSDKPDRSHVRIKDLDSCLSYYIISLGSRFDSCTAHTLRMYFIDSVTQLAISSWPKSAIMNSMQNPGENRMNSKAVRAVSVKHKY